MVRHVLRSFAIFLIAGVFASTAHAKEGSETFKALKFLFYGGNTPLVGSGSSGSAATVGGGLQLNLPLGSGHHWMIAPGGTYGLGHDSNTQTSGSITTKSSSSISTYAAFLDGLYYSDCCDDDDWYCGPGLYYSNTSITDKFTGSPDSKIKGIHSYGIQLTEGGGVPISKNLVLFGGSTQRLGITSYDNKTSVSEDKLSAITHAIQFQAGLKAKL